jgi:lysophospholipase L1-like esterase
MPQDKLFRKPVYILILTYVLLAGISTIDISGFLKKYDLRTVDIFSDLRFKPEPVHKTQLAIKQPAAIEKKKPVEDNDPLIANSDVKKIIRTDTEIEDQGNEAKSMNGFLRALFDLKKGKRDKVRVAYFGDSIIEGDLITQNVREKLQDDFGGNGVGFVPITSIVADFRKTIRHRFSDNWSDINYMNKRSAPNIGISGHTFFPARKGTVSLEGISSPHLSAFNDVMLLYGQADTPFSVSFNKHAFTLQSKSAFNVKEWKHDSLIKKVNIEVNGNSKTPIYGLSVEGEKGVILDNFSFRGTSGTELLRLNPKMLSQLDSARHYDLVILQYGPNLLFDPSITDFSWYYKQMTRTLHFLKKEFPNTSFLIVSSTDKASWNNGKFETSPGVEPLIEIQKQLARENNCAFFNLYETMGGYNSMVVWADKKPILAGKDYTHFNSNGAAKIGKMITRALMDKYDQYEKQMNALSNLN